MKYRLLRLVIMSLKFSCYLFILQAVSLTSLIASDASAQLRSVKDVYISVDFKDARIVDVFKDIEGQTDFKFHFFQRDIKNDLWLNISEDRASVAKVLYKIADAAGLKFRQVNYNIAVSKMDKTTRDAVTVMELVPVTGKVTDENGEALAGVNVVVEGTTQGTITDINGNFNVDAPQGATLIFSFIGYVTQEVEVGANTVINVQLESDVETLSEVVVTGYGLERRSEITGAITSVKGSDIEAVPLQSFDRAIQGRAAGVLVQSSFGVPGSAINVRIRGNGSINAGGDPLFIVDGVQINTRDDAIGVSANPLAAINPTDIESIEILKDAASASIYGSQAANGVVIINTKRGKAGKTKFNLHMYTGITEIINEMDMMNAQEYINWKLLQNRFTRSGGTGEPDLANEGRSRRSALDGFNADDWAPLGLSNDELGAIPQGEFDSFVNSIPSYDWQDAIFSNGYSNNVELSASGGNEQTRFFLSGGYNFQESQVEGVDFQRLSLRTNVDHEASEKITFNTSINISTIEQNGVNLSAWSFNNPVFGSIAILPFNSPTNDDGSLNVDRFRAGRVPLSPITNIVFDERNVNTFQLIGNFAINYQITPELKFRSFFGVDYRYVDSYRWEDPRTNDGARVNGRVRQNYETNFNWITTQHLNFSKQLSDVSRLDALAGVEFREERNEGTNLVVVGFPDPAFRTVQSGSETTSEGGFFTTWKLASLFSNFKYALHDKYFITLTARYDGSSRFGKNNRYGFFPALGAAWLLNNETFMSSLGWMDELKLRASYGITGNQSIGNFDSRGLVSSAGAGNYNRRAGLTLAGLENRDLTWEEQSTINIGVDYSLFRSRISGTFEVYRRRSDELLLDKNLPRTSGFADYTLNGGEVENRGLEISLNTVNVTRGDFEWKTSFNIAFIENELLSLLDDAQNDGSQFIVGEPLDVWYLFRYAGANPSNGRPMFYDRNGDITYNPQITGVGRDDDDRVAVGDSNSDFFGGFNNTFQYKGLKLDIFFIYDIGKTIYDRQAYLMYNRGEERQYNYYSDIVNQVWREPGDITPFGFPSDNRILPEERDSDLFLVDVSFVRLRQVSLSYDFPLSWVSKIGLTNANIYAQATNPLTWTGYTGYDPESTARGGTTSAGTGGNAVVGRFPGSKIYTFGLKIGF